jgi:type I restriction enzyme S subunit
MGLIKRRIGELVEQTIEMNSDLLYGASDVCGMTITKQIIPTKANMDGTELKRFLVVRPDGFVYNPRTHGKKIGLGYNDTETTFLISWNNTAFRVKPAASEHILAEYLFMHFNRPEWDREACYRSWGSSTEVFSWDALCEMTLDLPPLHIQQKYVDVYNAMLANQRAYEQGLEDLKLTCDAYIERLRHELAPVAIGELIAPIDERNRDNAITDFYGINIDKEFMPTVANTDKVNAKNYKIVRKDRFVFSGMQTGRDECIRIGLYNGDNPIIVSPAYATFEMTTDEILPEYFFMLFKRKEMDRLGWFLSDSSVRSNLDWDRFSEIKIGIPPLKVQESIVEIFNAYVIRREINERLKAQIKDICPILIKGSLEEAASA